MCSSGALKYVRALDIDVARPSLPGRPASNASAEAEAGRVQRDARADSAIQHGLHC